MKRLIGTFAIATALLLPVVAGCGGDHSPGADDDHGDDQHGHVIPAHRPRTFPDAVHRLRELNDRFTRESGAGDKALSIALDIANWLHEIAAESDLPKPEWDEVSGRAATIVADYRTVLESGTADRPARFRDAGAAIVELERIRDAADPRWFSDNPIPAGGPATSAR